MRVLCGYAARASKYPVKGVNECPQYIHSLLSQGNIHSLAQPPKNISVFVPACSCASTCVPAHTRRILLAGLTTRSLYQLELSATLSLKPH